MKKYSKLIWLTVIVLFVLMISLYWDDLLKGFISGYNAASK
jgi:hypothetical protein